MFIKLNFLLDIFSKKDLNLYNKINSETLRDSNTCGGLQFVHYVSCN